MDSVLDSLSSAADVEVVMLLELLLVDSPDVAVVITELDSVSKFEEPEVVCFLTFEYPSILPDVLVEELWLVVESSELWTVDGIDEDEELDRTLDEAEEDTVEAEEDTVEAEEVALETIELDGAGGVIM